MYIIVVGGGRVGRTLSENLLQMGHEVLVIERSQETCAALRKELGSMALCGDGCEAALLAEAGTERAGLFIAVTDEDEDNLVACQVAQHRFHVGKVIARVNNPRNERIFKKLGITSTVNAAEVLVNGVLHEVPGRSLTHLVPFSHAGLNLISVRVPKDAPCIGKPVTDLRVPEGVTVALVVRRYGLPLIPSSAIPVEEEDEIIALGRPEAENALLQALTG